MIERTNEGFAFGPLGLSSSVDGVLPVMEMDGVKPLKLKSVRSKRVLGFGVCLSGARSEMIRLVPFSTSFVIRERELAWCQLIERKNHKLLVFPLRSLAMATRCTQRPADHPHTKSMHSLREGYERPHLTSHKRTHALLAGGRGARATVLPTVFLCRPVRCRYPHAQSCVWGVPRPPSRSRPKSA